MTVPQYLRARAAIYELLGRRNPLGPIQAIDQYPVPSDGDTTIKLAGRPVREIIRVTVNGVDLTDFQLFNGFMIKLGKNCCSAGCGDQRGYPYFFGPVQYGFGSSTSGVGSSYPDTRYGRCRCWAEVEYVYGAPPNTTVQCAIDALSGYMCSCDCDGGACQCGVPANATSISRQGVTWQIEDVEELFAKGHTGIPEVDRLLAIYNPERARRRARVFTWSSPPPRRISAIRLPDEWVPTP